MDVYGKLLDLSRGKVRFALASIVASRGSTPQKAGANALIETNGRVWGTLGGGCLEAESRRRALCSVDEGRCQVFDLKLDEVTGWDDGLICGGQVRVFVSVTAAENAAAYEEWVAARRLRQRGILVTVISHPELPSGRVLWIPDERICDHPLMASFSGLDRWRASGRPGTVREQGLGELYIEPLTPSPRLLIAGAGHIGRSVSHLAARAGFEVTVIDDRAAFANRENLPDARNVICGDISTEMASISVDLDTYILIVTRGHRHDGAVLAACVAAPAAFIGMIGSRRKSLLIRRELIENGLASEQDVARVVSPVGVDIGAETIDEIAISIVAQLVAIRRNRKLDAPAKNFSRHVHRDRSGGRPIHSDETAKTAAPLSE